MYEWGMGVEFGCHHSSEVMSMACPGHGTEAGARDGSAWNPVSFF